MNIAWIRVDLDSASTELRPELEKLALTDGVVVHERVHEILADLNRIGIYDDEGFLLQRVADELDANPKEPPHPGFAPDEKRKYALIPEKLVTWLSKVDRVPMSERVFLNKINTLLSEEEPVISEVALLQAMPLTWPQFNRIAEKFESNGFLVRTFDFARAQ